MKLRILVLVLLLMIGSAAVVSAEQVIELDGMMMPHQIVEIRSPVEGIVEKIQVDRGDLVRKDQVLVVLVSEPEKAAVDLWQFRMNMEAATNAAKARLDVLTRKADRVRELFSEKIVSQAEYEEAEAERKLAEAEVLEARENRKLAELELHRAQEVLDMRSIKSPFSGVVIERNLNPGAVALSDDRKPILKLAAIDPIYVDAVAPVSLLGRFKVGDKIVVFPEVPADSQFTAAIKKVDLVADASSGTFAIRAELPNSKFSIPAGVKCRIRVSLK